MEKGHNKNVETVDNGTYHNNLYPDTRLFDWACILSHLHSFPFESNMEKQYGSKNQKVSRKNVKSPNALNNKYFHELILIYYGNARSLKK
jgi:hypothetical protein